MYPKYLTDKFFPAKRSKFQFKRNETVIFEHDNTCPNVSPHDLARLEANSDQNRSIELLCQPPYFSDFFVLVLRFFNDLQSLQVNARYFKILQLIYFVHAAFDQYFDEEIGD